MACNSPLTAFQPVGGGPLTFGKEPRNAREIKISCGQCMGCRLKRARDRAIRCIHEAQLHKHNCFVTLTYDQQNLPENGSLAKDHLQRFFKRLRHHKGPFRYFACGEYGDETQRAHYHACLFGIDFDDKRHFRKIGEHTLYLSKQLTEIWGHGNTSVGSLTFETAAYTANYVTKKLSKGQIKYNAVNAETGELIPLVQPFALMSLRPAIGRAWIDKFHQDIYSSDKDAIYVKGKKLPPPRYYDTIYDKIDSDHMAAIKSQRSNSHEGLTQKELDARETITRARQFSKKQI